LTYNMDTSYDGQLHTSLGLQCTVSYRKYRFFYKYFFSQTLRGKKLRLPYRVFDLTSFNTNTNDG